MLKAKGGQRPERLALRPANGRRGPWYVRRIDWALRALAARMLLTSPPRARLAARLARAAVPAVAVTAMVGAVPAAASAGFTQTQASNECVFQQHWETPAGGGEPYINVDKGLCRVDITWGDTPDMCPRDSSGNDGRGGDGAYHKRYFRTAYDEGVIAGGNLVSGGPDQPRLWTGTLGVAPTTADLFDEVDGEKLIGTDAWKLRLHCFYGPDVESSDLQIAIIVRGPNYTPPAGGGGGGGSQPPPASGGGTAPDEADTACDGRNSWGLDAAERRERRRLAELFYLNAWDGQRLAQDLDLFGLLLKALAAEEGVDTRAAERTIDAAGDLLAQESELANRQADLELERRLGITERASAAQRMRKAQNEIARHEARLDKVKEKHRGTPRNQQRRRQLKAAEEAFSAAQRDFDRADAALSRVQRELKQVTASLKKLRRSLGGTLTKLSRFLADSEAGRSLGNFLRVFNVAQDAAAAWMVVNAATAAILNRQARPPKGCDEGWTRKLPGPAVAAAASATKAGSGRPVTAAFGRVRSGRFLPRPRARALNRALGLLGKQVRVALSLERKTRGAQPTLPRATGRRLARLLLQGPSRFRALAAAVDLPRLPVTADALRLRDRSGGARGLRAELRRLGGESELISAARSAPSELTVDDVVDPFALFSDPALEDLTRRGASALLTDDRRAEDR